MFAPDIVFDSTNVIAENFSFQFKASGNVILDGGWQSYWISKRKEKTLPNYTEGQVVNLTPTMKAIAAPKRYTEADITDHVMDAMGIGRPSTQPAILEKLHRLISTEMANVANYHQRIRLLFLSIF